MNPALLIRLKPTTPWRIGTGTGARDQAEAVLHSDTLFSAVCSAFDQLGLLEEWLNATVKEYGEPAVRLSSCFPWQRGLMYAPPPAGLWPPPWDGNSHGGRVRWKGARLLPTTVIAGLLKGEYPSEDEWAVDGQSACLVPQNSRSATGPFRVLSRSSSAVDRLTGGQVEVYSTACVQFAPASGLWCCASFSSQATYAIWAPKVEAAFRLLSDNGMGGMRSRGYGRSRMPDFQRGLLPELLFGEGAAVQPGKAWWMLSLYSPAEADTVEWASGDYQTVVRLGRTYGAQASGEVKRASRMISEGSVVIAGQSPVGCARDVGPEGSPHPVYRAGYAVALPIPWRGQK